MKVESKPLHVPDLADLAQALQAGLEQNFAKVTVEAVDCPDLTQPPFYLAAPGICGQARLIDVGGPKYLTPLVNREKNYNFPEIAALAGLPGAFIIGAGAGSHRVMGVNSELMPNLHLESQSQNTHVATVDQNDQSKYVLQKYHSHDFSLMVNVLASEGLRDKVVHVRTECRTGPDNFVSCMRKALQKHYGSQTVGLGGVFVISSGTIKAHVMPDFSCVPLDTQQQVDDWLCFYPMEAPLTCLSVFVSDDMGLDLRVEHTHFFSPLEHGCGGHYHHDLDSSKEKVVYEGYFVPAHTMHRVDQP
eukprot:comp22995_c0_seq1/m.36616 comp22995_c0_seq1/g.36616  ORF comp22995_c0_seq1/g.36616 comp22995_c0_seq1/m.36616 type:complete len:303 (-) comp22995_c0_seq1:664-1572(-)